jgi:hypothetical protein
MNRKISLLSGLFVAAAVLGPNIPSTTMAAPLTSPPTVAEGTNALTQKAAWDDDWRYRRRYNGYRYRGYNDRCHHWRNECSGRGGWAYRRCLARHGC